MRLHFEETFFRAHHYGHYGHGVGWLGHSIGSAIIHGVIYSVLWRLMSHMTMGGALVFGVLAIGVVCLIYMLSWRG